MAPRPGPCRAPLPHLPPGPAQLDSQEMKGTGPASPRLFIFRKPLLAPNSPFPGLIWEVSGGGNPGPSSTGRYVSQLSKAFEQSQEQGPAQSPQSRQLEKARAQQ